MIRPFLKENFFSVSKFSQKKTSVSLLPAFPKCFRKESLFWGEINALERKTIPTKIPLRRNPSKRESSVTLSLPSVSKTSPDGDKSAKNVTEIIITSDGTTRTRRHLTQARIKNIKTKNQIVEVKMISDSIRFLLLALCDRRIRRCWIDSSRRQSGLEPF